MDTIFDLSEPRADVLSAQMRDEDFAADLSKVVKGTAPPEYLEARLFFQNTHPTRGLKVLLESVCRRLSGAGGELNSIIRLDTQYGGGKTHSLIALLHAVQGMRGVEGPQEFIDPALLPRGHVRVAALDGENADPANGLKLADNIFARTLWGEMAFRLAGPAGYERVRASDERHVAPGAETLIELFGDEPTLIVIDEVSVYLRKVADIQPHSAKQFPAFLQALVKAVASTPRVCLVTTLAVRQGKQDAQDAYREEQRLALQAFEEAESVLARKVMDLDPTGEDETVDVLRRRLFSKVDSLRAEAVVRAYVEMWERNADALPSITPEMREQFSKGYPFHPETLSVLTRKISSLSNFQRTRGMLRVLSRTVRLLWQTRPADATAIHPHHIDPAYEPLRQEFFAKLGQQQYGPAVTTDVSAVPGSEPSTAQKLDQNEFAGGPPIASYVARTVFLNTLAFGESAQGITSEHLRLSVCCPGIEPAFVEAARKRFAEESLYRDDRPGAPMRLRAEPNLQQTIQRAMKQVNADDVRAELNARAKELFASRGNSFELLAFPSGPYEIPDDVGDGRPYLVLLHYDAFHVSDGTIAPSEDLVRMATRSGTREDFRKLLNNVVFLLADERLANDMKSAVRRRLALESIASSPRFRDHPEYQQRQIKEDVEKSRARVAISIFQCYRHLYYPDGKSTAPGEARLARATVELPSTSESPGNGQVFVRRILKDQKKLLAQGDQPDAPTFVRDNTPLKTRGSSSTRDLREEYRRAPNLSILLDDGPLVQCIRNGIDQDTFVLRRDTLVWGKGDPSPSIVVDDNTFVHTMADAKAKGLWPRPAPEPVVVTVPALGGASITNDGKPITGATGPTSTKAPASASPLSAEGPLRAALADVFEKARKTDVRAIASLSIRIYEHRGAWNLHQAVAAMREADVECSFEARMADDGMQRFDVSFAGNLTKASTVKSLIERPLQSAREQSLEAKYTLAFKTPLSTSQAVADDLVSKLTRFGAAEAYVEAYAAAKAEVRT